MLLKIFLFLLTPVLLICETPFVLFTVPKSGTHLSVKLLKMLTGKCEDWVAEGNNDFFTAYHQKFANGSFRFMHLSTQFDPNMYNQVLSGVVPIVNVRDPRDVCVSSVFYFRNILDQLCGKEADFNTRLSYTIQCQERTLNFCPLFFFQGVVELIYTIQPLVLRFEDLVGPKGGGSLKAQLKTVYSTAASLQIPLSKSRAYDIAYQLFGDSLTFREGQIGSWRTHFTEEHKAQFKESGLEYYLILFGYERNHEW